MHLKKKKIVASVRFYIFVATDGTLHKNQEAEI